MEPLITGTCRFFIVRKDTNEPVDYFISREHAEAELEKAYNDGNYYIHEATK